VTALRERVLRVLRDVAPDIDPAELAPDVDIRRQYDFDSMDTLNFAIGLKRAFGVDIPDADFRELASLDRCLAYLAPRIGASDTRESGA
jgi:acyl carrier protein